MSRKHALEIDPVDSFVTIFGGKITDCLNIGEEVCDAVIELGVRLDKDRKDWYGEPPKATRDEFFRQARLMGLDKLRKRASFETLSTRLWRRYGMRAFAMLEAIRDDPSMADEIIDGAEYVRVELFYAAKTEMIPSSTTSCGAGQRSRSLRAAGSSRMPKGIREACELLFGETRTADSTVLLRGCASSSGRRSDGRESTA